MLALLGHLLKLQGKWGVLKSGRGGLEELAQRVQAAVSTAVWSRQPCSAVCTWPTRGQ